MGSYMGCHPWKKLLASCGAHMHTYVGTLMSRLFQGNMGGMKILIIETSHLNCSDIYNDMIDSI
jgi:hypothetical protein